MLSDIVVVILNTELVLSVQPGQYRDEPALQIFIRYNFTSKLIQKLIVRTKNTDVHARSNYSISKIQLLSKAGNPRQQFPRGILVDTRHIAMRMPRGCWATLRSACHALT